MQMETEEVLIQQTKPQVVIDQNQLIPHKYLSPMYFISSRPQYQRSCGMSALITIFNYQFSTLGQGKLNPITVEEAYLKLNVIGTGSRTESRMEHKSESIQSSKESLEDYLNKLDFGYFTYSETILKWYRLLCRAYKVKGKCYFFYKKTGKFKTQLQGQKALKAMVSKMVEGKTQFVYRCYDHYFSPVGYQIIGNENYNSFEDRRICQIFDNSDTSFIVAETAKRFAPFHVIKWSDMELDLSTNYPRFYDVRNIQKGIWTKKGCENQQQGNSYHGIMAFERI